MIRTLIVDDEENNRERLRKVIGEHFPHIGVIGEADGVATALAAINSLKPELVLLDIKMADGTAFDLLRQINPVFFKIIFVTAYEEYALKAFKFSALDYLLKPVSVDDLREAFFKAENQILDHLRLQLTTLQGNWQSSKSKTLVLRTSEKIYLVGTKDICYCESDRNYTVFYLPDHRKYLVSQPMKEYEEILVDYGFVRIHKSYLVNLAFIESFDKREGGTIILRDKTELPVSRRKKTELLGLFSRL